MSYRRSVNRRDGWIKHREKSAAQFAEMGLPPAAYETERALREFLTTGVCEDIGLTLDALSEEQFWKLFHYATSTFDYDVVTFTALERRRLHGCSVVGPGP